MTRQKKNFASFLFDIFFVFYFESCNRKQASFRSVCPSLTSNPWQNRAGGLVANKLSEYRRYTDKQKASLL